jgi:hypothetical protein
MYRAPLKGDALITNLARWSTGPMLALTLTGCYVMPIQVEEGKPPVYAYMPVGSGQLIL